MQPTVPDPQAAVTESTAALANALRTLIREEINRPEPPKPESSEEDRPPTWVDGFWLLMLVCNVVLLAALVPADWWKSPVLEQIGKLLPWLGGGTFVLGATWFKDRMLAFSRHPSFKITMSLILLPLFLLQIPIVPLQPTILPPGSELFVDGVREKSSFSDGKDTVWLRIRDHDFRIAPKGGIGLPDRQVRWSWLQLAKAKWNREKPVWGLIYPVDVVTPGMGSIIRIAAADGGLDSDFEDDLLVRKGSAWEYRPEDAGDTLSLPFGTYYITVTMPGCQELSIPHISVPVTLKPPLRLNELKCP